MRIQKAESEGEEKVAASLVPSFVANLFAPPFLPPTVFSLSLALGMQEKRLSRLLTAKGVVILRGLQKEAPG